MLSSRVAINFARRITVKPALKKAVVKRNLSEIARPSIVADFALPTSHKLINNLSLNTTFNVVEKAQHAHLYRNEILESLFAPEAVVEDEIIEECIKRTYQPNWKRRKAKHGFLSRNATASGRKVNRRRAATGRRISV